MPTENLESSERPPAALLSPPQEDHAGSDIKSARGEETTTLDALLRRLIWQCVLPLILLAVCLSISHVMGMRAQMHQQATLLLHNFATSLDHNIGARIAGLQVLTASPLIEDPTQLRALFQQAQGFKNHFGGEVIFADESMQMLLNTRTSFGASLPKLPQPRGYAAAPAALASGKPAVGDMFLGPIAKVPMVAIAAPLNRDSKVRFLLLNIIETSLLQLRLNELALPAEWILTVFDSTNGILAQRGAPGTIDRATSDEWSERFVTKLAISGWSVVLEIPRTVYLAPATAAAISVLGLILFTTVLGVGAGRRAGRRLLRALQSLTEPETSRLVNKPVIAEIEAVRLELVASQFSRESAQSALSESESRFQNLFDNNYATMLVIDPDDGRIIYANPAATNYYGWSREELVRKNISDINTLPPEKIAVEMRAAVEERRSHFQFRHRLANGTERDVEVFNGPVVTGGRTMLCSIVHDITERLRTAVHLESQYRLLNALINSAKGIVIFSLDRDYRYTAFNEKHAHEMRTVWNAEIRLGTSLLDSMADARLRDLAKESIDRTLAGESFTEIQFQPGFDIHYELMWNPIVRGDGEIVGVTLFARDITGRKRAELALLESEGRYRTLVEWSPEPLAVHQRGKIIYVNPASVKMFGAQSAQELIGKPILDVVHPAFHDVVKARMKGIGDSGNDAPLTEMKFIKRDGTVVDVEAQSTAVFIDGELAIHAVARDITERKKAEIRLSRVTQLYALLSQCNQAIVRCTSEAELFPQICRDVVVIGGLKFAWIGLVDGAGRQIKSVAEFGEGKDYFCGIDIPVIGDSAGGDGPTSTAILENRAVWCQDFLNDPRTVPWHERAARLGWAASAALPLHRFGVAIGAISFYAAEINAFDEDVQALLAAMSLDISFALDSYARDAARKEAEESLRESESFSLAILDSVSAEVAVLNRDGTIIAVNEPWLRFALENSIESGKPAPHTSVGSNYFAACRHDQSFLSDGANRAVDGIRAVVNGSSYSFSMEYDCHSPTAQRWFSMNVTPLGPDVRGVVVTHSNITERKLSQQALHQSNQRFRDLVDSTDGIVWEADAATFNFVFVSNNAERMFGYPATDWLRPGFWASHIHPDDRDQAVEYCAACTSRLEDHEFEYRFIGQDGQVLWMADSVKVVKERGKASCLRGLMIDITARKRAEVEFRTLSRAMEQSTASIVITDQAGMIEYVNPRFEQVTGYTRAEVVGGNPRVLQSGITPLEVYQQMWAVITVGGEWRGELCNRRKNGELFWEFATISGVRSVNGEIEHYIAVKEDMTARKRAEAAHEELQSQLRESQKMQAIGTLAGGIAHDFNNIIATILGNVELARRDASTHPLALECIEEIRKAGSRARDLVQQILSFSRRQPTARKLIALDPVVAESVRLLRSTLPARAILEIQLAPDVPLVFADATQIEQVVINLVNNAVQAMHNNAGHITIRLGAVMLDAALATERPALEAMHANRPGVTVSLAVSDDGPGMDEATLLRIFEPFFTTKPAGEGTGLGLSVVHGIVQTHDGVIAVESQPGMGSTFTLYLPAVAPTLGGESLEEGVTVTAPAQSPDGAQHILYIDDDEALVFLIKRILERRGYRISGYVDQREALAALRADPAAFDLVVTDYNMPGMSGLDVARQIRMIRADLPVAVASGFIDEALRLHAAGAGVRELIFKANAAEELGEAFTRVAQSIWRNSIPP